MTTLNDYTLQYRWQVVETKGMSQLLYYGVRNPPNQRNVLIEVSSDLAAIIKSDKSLPDTAETRALIEQGILVTSQNLRNPKTSEYMQTCIKCINNDFVIPGLEFNDDGVCALCQCYAQTKAPERSAFATVSETELLKSAKDNTQSRFDVMVLYTGGKDSSYMLWLLARKLKLRVMAAFWNMPYCSKAAYENIQRAREKMPEVEFVEWSLPLNTVHEAMRLKWRSHGWPCLCPTAAFPVLYPLAANLRIPYVFLGLEDVQAAVLDYVVADPTIQQKTPPTQRDQTLAFLSARALPRPQKTPLRWLDEMSNYHAAINAAVPDLFKDLVALINNAQQDSSINIPLIGRLSTNEEYGSWDDARKIIEDEMGWQAPVGQNSLLHTSCAIEPVKDYLQFQRFKAMRTVFMPQSIVELSAAVFFGLTSREDALEALKELGYWQPPAILEQLTADLGISKAMVSESKDELRYSLAEWAGLL